MKSADSERDFNWFLRTVCVEPVDSQNDWRRRQFMDTVAWFGNGSSANFSHTNRPLDNSCFKIRGNGVNKSSMEFPFCTILLVFRKRNGRDA
jgi:hypothetical protein